MSFLKRLYGEHDKEEFIRTIDSILSLLMQSATLGVQIYALWWLMHHGR